MNLSPTASGLLIVFAGLASPAIADISTQGHCSPGNVEGTHGNVVIKCVFGTDPSDQFSVEYVDAHLECNAQREKNRDETVTPSNQITITSAPEMFRRLRRLDGDFAFIDIAVLVGGYGCGLYEIEAWDKPKWGVVYDVMRYLDGFPGNQEIYLSRPRPDPQTGEIDHLSGFGYRMELDKIYPDYSGGWASVFPFPQHDDAYFQATYGRFMRLYGFARVRVTDVQGTEIIEALPAIPVGGLATHFSRLKDYVEEGLRSSN